jgi:hypothetical protein
MRALLATACLAAAAAQLPVWHSPMYQCKDALAPWPVCKDPRALAPGYRMKNFTVWAWAGPWGYDSITTSPAEMDAYVGANFNVAQISDRNLAHRCLTFNESFAFLTQGVLAAAARGMTSTLDPYGPITRPYDNRYGGVFPWGAGNIYADPPSYTKHMTPPELEWLIPLVRDDPRFASVSSILVSDDAVDLTVEELQMMARIAEAIPDVIPIVNQCGNGKIWLARSGSPVVSGELYSMMDPTQNVSDAAAAQAGSYDGERSQTERWKLWFWPMLGATNYDSYSVTAFQANAAYAYGADGLAYFLWSFQGQGLWNNSLATPAPNPNNYAGGREANGNGLAWGDDLLGFPRLAAVYHTGAWAPGLGGGGSFTALPGDGILASMDDELMLGLKLPEGEFDGGAGAAPCALVGAGDADAVAVLVDKRVQWSGGAPAARTVVLQFGGLVQSAELVEVDLAAIDRRRRAGLAFDAAAVTRITMLDAAFAINVTLTGGSAVMLRLHAATAAAFTAAARDLKNWRVDPHTPQFFEVRNAQQNFYNNEWTGVVTSAALPTSWSHMPMAILDVDELAASPAAVARLARWAAPLAQGRCGAAQPDAALLADAGTVLRAWATAGFNLFSARSTAGGGEDSTYDLMQAAMAAGSWLLVAPPDGGSWTQPLLKTAFDA